VHVLRVFVCLSLFGALLVLCAEHYWCLASGAADLWMSTTGASLRERLISLLCGEFVEGGVSAPISSLYLSVPDGAMHLQMHVPKAMGTTLWIGVRQRRSVVSAAAPFYKAWY